MKKRAFSLAEMMVVMVILTIVLAAAAPIISKRAVQQVNTTATATSGGVPVGTIIAWALTTLPQGNDVGKWLECNGQTVNAVQYPKLAALMSNVPDYRNQFLEGSTTPNTIITAGLPNITGTFMDTDEYGAPIRTGCFYSAGSGGAQEGGGHAANNPYTGFSASLSSPIYGNSTTVQPPATTVKYLIKAKD